MYLQAVFVYSKVLDITRRSKGCYTKRRRTRSHDLCDDIKGVWFWDGVERRDLLKINTSRENKKCSDEEAAVEVRGHSTKNALTSSPFVIKFEYGKEGEGYWDYNHMVLQLEDCADVVQILKRLLYQKTKDTES